MSDETNCYFYVYIHVFYYCWCEITHEEADLFNLKSET